MPVTNVWPSVLAFKYARRMSPCFIFKAIRVIHVLCILTLLQLAADDAQASDGEELGFGGPCRRTTKPTNKPSSRPIWNALNTMREEWRSSQVRTLRAMIQADGRLAYCLPPKSNCTVLKPGTGRYALFLNVSWACGRSPHVQLTSWGRHRYPSTPARQNDWSVGALLQLVNDRVIRYVTVNGKHQLVDNAVTISAFWPPI